MSGAPRSPGLASPRPSGDVRLARAALTYLAEPGDPALGALLAVCDPAEVLAAIKADTPPEVSQIGSVSQPSQASQISRASRAALGRALARWRVRLPKLPADAGIAAASRDGIRLVCPEDAEWPSALDQLGPARPYALWLRGNADLRFACARSVSVVGSRAATSYGTHVAGEIAADLGERGWAVVSGGAYGIDAAAHRGALAVEGVTIAVLACGVDYPYPAGHADLFAAICAQGLVVSEWPPGSRPARTRFLIRNRVIAALACGTVIVEAGERSGALNTARHAADLGKPLMAVPGPVTSAQSAGCHRIIREWCATCVTRAADIIEMLSPLSVPDPLAPGGGPQPSAGVAHASVSSAGASSADPPDAYAPEARAPEAHTPDAWPLGRGGPSRAGVLPQDDDPPCRDDLDADCARVLDALPSRGGAGTSTVAVEAGVDLDTVLRCLGQLASLGFIERCDRGWRLRRHSRS
ncbi:MAG TPA: DNA-processing protein DprA [Streptosporangiaceae bacterium]|nr:DNA-processing protein DprA [Streptosporangiaceae bacterium]